MSKKRLVTLILSIGIFLSLAATVFAAGQPRRYNENSTVKGTISQSFYQVNAKLMLRYEGYVPKDWKTQSLAVNFHNEMFTYNAWNVVGWA